MRSTSADSKMIIPEQEHIFEKEFNYKRFLVHPAGDGEAMAKATFIVIIWEKV